VRRLSISSFLRGSSFVSPLVESRWSEERVRVG
jgi:hypothetical protein